MTEHRENKSAAQILKYLPKTVAKELESLTSGANVTKGISELRLRLGGVCEVVVNGRSFPISAQVSDDELRCTVRALCGGALYAHRDSISKGYLTAEGGIRVGIAGQAIYENGRIVGVDKVSCLVFRLPIGKCPMAKDIYDQWQRAGGGNLLVCAPPAGGKTTVLRFLAAHIGSGKRSRRVVVVDERCEFLPEDYGGCTVDVIRGYERDSGIELALRTLSPEVIIVDEIVTEAEACAVLKANGAGITVIASVHANNMDSLLARSAARRLVECGMFSQALFLYGSGSGREFLLREVEPCVI